VICFVVAGFLLTSAFCSPFAIAELLVGFVVICNPYVIIMYDGNNDYRCRLEFGILKSGA